ncbi:MAG: AraC family transcriptional regulator [Cyanothece sp. SIO1E1]|nr:AraC family transcriptional regulator [Cyanothece sp. SIO1E1]
MELLLQLGGLQAILLALMLFFRTSAAKTGRKWLAWLLLTLGMASVCHALDELSFYLEFPHLIRLNWGLPLCLGPLLYLYVRQLTAPEVKLSQADFQHFSPYILNLLLLLPFLFQDGESKIQVLDYFTAIISRGTDIYQTYYYILHIGIAYWGWHYTLKCLPLLNNYRERLLANYSDIEKRQLNWMQSIVYGFMGLFTLFVLSLVLNISSNYPDFDYEQYFYLGSFVLVYWMTFKSVKLEGDTAPPQTEIPTTTNTTKPVEVDSKQKDQLLEYMLTEKPYLNSELTAVDLAQTLGLTRHQLSQILNEQLGKNFYDFINAYRVDAFKAHLEDPAFANYNLLGLALESGFKSKSSFNSIFKKVTGMTPSQYKKGLSRP